MNYPNYKLSESHTALVQSILIARQANFNNYVAEANESLSDFSKQTARQRKLEMQLLTLRSKNAHIKGYRAVIVGNRIKESINGMVL